jgi:hypothetical protein
LTTDTRPDVVPLSRFPGRLHDFVGLLRYRPGPRREHRFAADHALLDKLQQRRSSEEPIRETLTAAVVQAVVDEVEALYWPNWTLAGTDSDDVFTRLDNHFVEQQRRYQAELTERSLYTARRMEESAVQTAEAERRAVEEGAVLWGLPPMETPQQPNALRRFTGDLGPWPEGTSDETLQQVDELPDEAA